MDTHFEFTCLLFLSRFTFRYQQTSFKAVKFDNKLTNPELEKLLKEIYDKTNSFQYLQKYLKRKKDSSLVFCMTIATMMTLMLAAFSGFQIVFFLIFLLISLLTMVTIVWGICLENFYNEKMKDYEKIIINILRVWNSKYKETGIKFSVMRSFYVLMIHADYKKSEFKYNLSYGKRVYDKNGKYIDPRGKKKGRAGQRGANGAGAGGSQQSQNSALNQGGRNAGSAGVGQGGGPGGSLGRIQQGGTGATTVVRTGMTPAGGAVTKKDESKNALRYITMDSERIKI